MLAVIAALIALVYWTGWHATFYNGSVLCHGVFVNLSEGQGRSGVSLPAVVVGKPEGDREFYSLRA